MPTTRALLQVVALVVLAGCKPKPEALQKTLASEDPVKRERAAKALQTTYAQDPLALGDHGKPYWEALIAKARSDPEARRDLHAHATPIRYLEGAVYPTSAPMRVDAFWTTTFRYERDPNDAMRSGTFLGADPLERNVEGVRVSWPDGFTGTWTTYYVNGAVEIKYEVAKDRRVSHEYYDDGQLRQEDLYSLPALLPIGLLVHYYPDGKKAYEQPYTDGKMNGTERQWFPSGQLKYEWPHVDGKREGPWKHFRENGELDLCILYRAEVEVSRDCK